MENEELVRKAKNGDKQAFAMLYEQIYKEMYRFAYCLLHNASDAEDMVSETVLDAYKGISLLRDDKLFKSWMFKILSNKCKRKLASYVNKAVPIDESIEVQNSDEKDNESVMDLRDAFKELSYEEKLIVNYSVVCGYNSKEIGQFLNMSSNTVRSKLSRAISKMKGRMEVSV